MVQAVTCEPQARDRPSLRRSRITRRDRLRHIGGHLPRRRRLHERRMEPRVGEQLRRFDVVRPLGPAFDLFRDDRKRAFITTHRQPQHRLRARLGMTIT